MRNIYHIAINGLRVFFAERGNLIGLTVLPIFISVALGIATGNDPGPGFIRIDVIDNNQTEATEQFVQALSDAYGDTVVICPQQQAADNRCRLDTDGELTLDDALQRIDDGVVRAVIELPADFDRAIESLEAVQISYYSREDLTQGASPVRQTLDAVVRRLNAAGIAARVGTEVAARLGPEFSDTEARQEFQQAIYENAQSRLGDPPASVSYTLSAAPEEDATDAANANGFSYSAPGIGAMAVLFTVLGGMATLVRERKNGTLARLMVLPLRRGEILGGRILQYFILGMIQYAILLVLGLAFGVNYGSDPLAFLLLVTAYVLCVTALTFAVATWLRTEAQASSLATLLALTLAPLGGAWWPLNIVPDFMQVIGHLSPVAWVMDGFIDLIFLQGNLLDVLPEIGVLLVATVVLFLFGIWRFRYE